MKTLGWFWCHFFGHHRDSYPCRRCGLSVLRVDAGMFHRYMMALGYDDRGKRWMMGLGFLLDNGEPRGRAVGFMRLYEGEPPAGYVL